MFNCNKQQFSLYQINSPGFYLKCCCSYVTFKIPLTTQSPAFQTVQSCLNLDVAVEFRANAEYTRWRVGKTASICRSTQITP